MDPRSDEPKLLRQASQGDKDALAELYERYVDAIYRFMLYRTRDHALAEDLTAEVFAQVIQSIHRYEERGLPFGAWLFAIARARLVDHIRRQKRRPVAPASDLLCLPDKQAEAAPEQVLDEVQFLSLLHPLTERQREAVLLRFVGELSHAEIAEVTGSTANAVKQLMYRALNRLRKALEEP
ncbi:MAG: sigma-70 family RNA polymerase sigma factor [Anaerolineae bacterium]|nr:sigma-70 family RNA polymerase sigma factor [Anaerolineae bacterium]